MLRGRPPTCRFALLLNRWQDSKDAQFEMHTLLHALSNHLSSQQVTTLIASLQWVHMLLGKSASRVMQLSEQLWPPLFKCLSNQSVEVVRLDIEALARMAPDAAHSVPLCEHLLQLLRHERALLERRGALIVKQLCELLEPRDVYVTLARGLTAEEDLEFASQMVRAVSISYGRLIKQRLLVEESHSFNVH